ncbi:hypothetical protein GQ42DRAFT_164950 [Ramicandelaber brevisporus]|nr:hypothetical protein GQ42DRAFT_164950 [Ramicandelaber brevisporus]
MTTTPTGGTGAGSHSNHPLDNDEGRRRQGTPACDARGGGESQRRRGRTKRGRGTDGTCRWENPDASHTNLAAEDNHHAGPNTAPAHAGTWGQRGNNAGYLKEVEEKLYVFGSVVVVCRKERERRKPAQVRLGCWGADCL